MTYQDHQYTINGTPIGWDLERGLMNIFGINAVTLWVNPSMASLIKPLADEIGHELFCLLVARSASLGTIEDMDTIREQGAGDFLAGFSRWSQLVSVAGWGSFHIESLDFDQCTAVVDVDNTWELFLNDQPEQSWGCPFIQGKLVGIFNQLFEDNCWAEQEFSITERGRRVRFHIHPSNKTVNGEINRLRLARSQAHEQLIESLVRKRLKQQQPCADNAVMLETLIDERTEELQRVNQELAQKNIELEILSTRDALTGLYNRRQAIVDLDKKLALARRYNNPLSIFMIDIDFFKDINDRFGHSVGDLALVDFARFLLSKVRAVDCVARFGGEEFLIILDRTSEEEALCTAQKLYQALDSHRWDSRYGELSFSMGINSFQSDICSGDLINGADRALYQAKAQGRRQFARYRPST